MPMLVTQQEQLRSDVNALVDKLGPGRSSLIPILQDVKWRYHDIDSDAMQIIADLLDIHPVEVYSVATFYAFLDPAAQGEYVVRLCRTVSCELAGKDAIARQLETELGIGFGETTEDGRFTLDWAACMGMCDQGPALLVNDRVYTSVTPETVREIAADCRAASSGHAAEREEGYLV
jgi:[NiFe] hydrogenase diaphorase moiety large subunit